MAMRRYKVSIELTEGEWQTVVLSAASIILDAQGFVEFKDDEEVIQLYANRNAIRSILLLDEE